MAEADGDGGVKVAGMEAAISGELQWWPARRWRRRLQWWVEGKLGLGFHV